MIVAIPVKITGPTLPDAAMNVWHVRDGSLIDDHEIGFNEALGHLEAFYTAIAGLYPSGHTIAYDGEATEVGVEEPGLVTGLDTFTVAATGASDALPAANCLMVSWRTEVATRRGRGRTFIGPLTVSVAEDNGTPEESNRSALQGAVDDLRDWSVAPVRAGVSLGVWSVLDNVLRDFVDGNVPNRFGILKSRRD